MRETSRSAPISAATETVAADADDPAATGSTMPDAPVRPASRHAETKRNTTARTAVTRNPERTRAAILDAARWEVAEKGFAGARIDVIAKRADINKRMLYHYFGDKEAIYVAVLEDTYRSIRCAEGKLELSHRDPEEALRDLAMFTWRYYIEHPEFLSILATENLLHARYLRQSKTVPEMHSNFQRELAQVLQRGGEAGVFRAGLDPVAVYITIASLGFFYLQNRHTLGTIFGRDLSAEDALETWGRHIVDTVLASVRPLAG